MGKEQSKLKPRDLNELARTTTFSQQEIKAYYKEFKKNSKTGAMTVDDFKQLYSKFFPDGDPSEFAQHTFRVFDENGDGILDFRELIVSMSVMKRGNMDDRLKWAFNMYDIDGNGYITRDELLDILTAIEKLSGSENDEHCAADMANDIFERVDKNADGKLSLEEFLEGAKVDNDLASMLHSI
ncbi:neurocalcin homolog [Dendronephthya gigantea]|uniref:neurocalcin homolog n=1 Tax=Dendronephthya gigantea TaxID=151771 RepID=UPI00106CBE8B|nr:neurocalcin homolog [Dendronephthya gigantea]